MNEKKPQKQEADEELDAASEDGHEVSGSLEDELDQLDPLPSIDVKYPVKVWYQSKSHGKDRYYVGFANQRVQWTYAPGDATLILCKDHLVTVLALCQQLNYRKLQVHEVDGVTGQE